MSKTAKTNKGWMRELTITNARYCSCKKVLTGWGDCDDLDESESRREFLLEQAAAWLERNQIPARLLYIGKNELAFYHNVKLEPIQKVKLGAFMDGLAIGL